MPFPRDTSARRLRLLATWALAGSLALSACGGDPDEPADEAEREKQGTADGATFSAASPLTGLPLKGDAPKHPVLAVKIDNSSSSRPQVGLGSADMVAEELVEGGMTRLAVFFYSDVPATVGPVRSMRATDIGIVQPLGAALVASGGAPQTVSRVRGAGIEMFTEGAAGYYRDSGRPAPYNLMMRLHELARTVEGGEVPDEYLPFGDDGLPKGQPARTLTASFSGGSSTTFEYRKGGYANTDTNAGADDQFVPATVLVLRVEVGDAGYLDPAGNPVPETKFTGQGEALVFHGGRVVRGRWAKDGLDATVRLSTKGGELALPPGKVWIELVPVNGGGVSFAK